ncbi:MAG: hypothetical protein AAF657_10220 [Acidobacteriota bacterium]
MSQAQGQDLDLGQEVSFGEYALPQMSSIGEAGRSILEPKLALLAKEWAFSDRLLNWLVPSLESDIESFYRSNGPGMLDMFAEHQLVHLDRDLSQQLLKRMLRIDRNATVTVIRWLEENGPEMDLEGFSEIPPETS